MKNVYNSIMHELKQDRFHDLELSGNYKQHGYYISVYGDEINFSIYNSCYPEACKFSTSVENLEQINGCDAFEYYIYNMYKLNKYEIKSS